MKWEDINMPSGSRGGSREGTAFVVLGALVQENQDRLMFIDIMCFIRQDVTVYFVDLIGLVR